MTIFVSSECNHCFGSAGNFVFLFDDSGSLVGGWTGEAFQYAAEALKAAIPKADVQFDSNCEDGSRKLWDSIKVFNWKGISTETE